MGRLIYVLCTLFSNCSLLLLERIWRGFGEDLPVIQSYWFINKIFEMKCSKWKLAIITELINGNNGLVRAAKIRMNEIETTRPIVKIFPLEVTMNTFSQEKSVSDEQSSNNRPKCTVNIKARQNIRDWLNISWDVKWTINCDFEILILLRFIS